MALMPYIVYRCTKVVPSYILLAIAISLSQNSRDLSKLLATLWYSGARYSLFTLSLILTFF